MGQIQALKFRNFKFVYSYSAELRFIFVIVIEKDDLELALKIFNINKSGNYLEEASRNKTGYNILHLQNFPNEEIRNDLDKIQSILFQTREKRIHPSKDDKI